MHPIEEIGQQLVKEYPFLLVSYNPPLRPDGVHSLDLNFLSRRVSLECNDATIFMMTDCRGHSYGTGPDVVTPYSNEMYDQLFAIIGTQLVTSHKYIHRWISDLRSGDYKQGREELRIVTACGLLYCCLGVAVMSYNALCPSKSIVPVKGSSLLTPTYQELGLRSQTGSYSPLESTDERYRHSLAALNDSYCRTFSTIADFIELNRNDNRDNLFVKGFSLAENPGKSLLPTG